MAEEIIEEFDKNGNCIHYKDKNRGYEDWTKYDENNRIIYLKNNDGYENWIRYSKTGRIIEITEKEFNESEVKRKEWIERNKYNRFEIMDI